MKSNKDDYKDLKEEQREALRPLAQSLDIVKVRLFPDASSPIPKADQIAADKAAARVMAEIHSMNALGHLPSHAIPDEDRKQADLAYLQWLYQRGGEQALVEEQARRRDHARLMQENQFSQDGNEAASLDPTQPVEKALSQVTFIEVESSVQERLEPSAMEARLRSAEKLPYWETRLEANLVLAEMFNHGTGKATDYIAVARSLASCAKKEPKLEL